MTGGRILNFDKVIVETVTVAVRGGPTWELRDDVPAGTLAMAFRVFDLERQLFARQPDEEPLDAADERVLYDRHEDARLDAVLAIVQHTYPEVTRDEVAQALSPAAQGQVLQVFFPLLLRRFGRQSSASAETVTPTTPQATRQTQETPAVRAGTGVTRSRKR